MKKMICPKCGKSYTGHPAISRRDNKTKICPDCGVSEAMTDFMNYCNGITDQMKKDFGLKGANS